MDDYISGIEDVSGNGNFSVPTELKQAISLDKLTKSLNEYFPNRESYPACVRQPFTFSVDTADVNDKYFDEIVELQQSQVQQQLFTTTTLSTFWCHQIVAYPLLAKKVLELFVTTYVCEKSFSTIVNIKTKTRNRLCCKNVTRVALQSQATYFKNFRQKGQFFEPISSNRQNCYQRNYSIKILNVFGLFHEALVGEIIACLINLEK